MDLKRPPESCNFVSIGTHGNGMGYGNLATLVNGLEFVSGKGKVGTVIDYFSILLEMT